MITYLGKSCSFCLPRVPFVNCRQFMYLINSLLVLRAGYGIWLYQFLIIAYLFCYARTYVRTQDRQTDGLQAMHIYIHASAPARARALHVRTRTHGADKQTAYQTYIHACMHARPHARMCVRKCMWAYGRACMSVSVCERAYMSVRYMRAYVRACLYLCLSVCMSVRLCERACLPLCLFVYLSVCLFVCCCLYFYLSSLPYTMYQLGSKK